MKCTNCGKKEAIYHYVTSLNGDVTETHLCADCARKAEEENGESPWTTMERSFNDSVKQLFGDDPWMQGFLPGGFFGGERRQRGLLDSFFGDDLFAEPRFGTMMLPGFFIPARRERQEGPDETAETGSEQPAQAEQENKKTSRLGSELRQKKQEVDKAIAHKREILALREQMHRAARAEDYEKAAKLRDQLKTLEAQDRA